MPGLTVMVQLACGLGIFVSWPSRLGVDTSTRHCRHAPAGSSSGWSQKRGMAIPSSSATRMSSAPLGACTSMPSMVSGTVSAGLDRGRRGLGAGGQTHAIPAGSVVVALPAPSAKTVEAG
jgi:hypothetical protein